MLTGLTQIQIPTILFYPISSIRHLNVFHPMNSSRTSCVVFWQPSVQPALPLLKCPVLSLAFHSCDTMGTIQASIAPAALLAEHVPQCHHSQKGGITSPTHITCKFGLTMFLLVCQLRFASLTVALFISFPVSQQQNLPVSCQLTHCILPLSWTP